MLEIFRLEMGFGFLTRRVINLCSSLPGTRADSAWGPSRGCQVPAGYLVSMLRARVQGSPAVKFSLLS